MNNQVLLTYTPKTELLDRTIKLQELLISNNVDGALIVQKADLFYFSGTCQNAHLFIPAVGDPVLLVKKNFARAQTESSLNNVLSLDSLDKITGIVHNSIKKPGKIGMELDVLPANLYFKYKKLLNLFELCDISKLIREIRMIKSPYEIEKLKEAAKLNFLMFSEVRNILSSEMMEVELAGELEAIYRRHGHQGAVRMRGFNQEIFYGHLMSGWNLAYPSFFDGPTGGTGLNPSYPQSASFKRIERNEPIMIDYVGVLNGYMVDQARIFSIGTLSNKFTEAYDVAVQIKHEIRKHAAPGVNGKDLFEMASQIASSSSCGKNFLGANEKVSFVGHGIGIELDELPVIARSFDMTLQAGMVFALEPKFIFEDGVVGIEDTFYITESGCEQITIFDESIQSLIPD